MILDDAQIEAKMQDHINSVWPPSQREKAMRLGGTLLADLTTFFEGMTTMKAQMIADRDAAKAVYDAEIAVAQASATAV